MKHVSQLTIRQTSQPKHPEGIQNQNMKVLKQAISVLMMLSSVNGFSMNGIPGSRHTITSPRRTMPAVSMAKVDDEIAALRAAAQKARDEAKRLSKVSRLMFHLLKGTRVLK